MSCSQIHPGPFRSERKRTLSLLIYKAPQSCPSIISQDFKEGWCSKWEVFTALGFQLSEWQLRWLIGSAVLASSPKAFYSLLLPLVHHGELSQSSKLCTFRLPWRVGLPSGNRWFPSLCSYLSWLSVEWKRTSPSLASVTLSWASMRLIWKIQAWSDGNYSAPQEAIGETFLVYWGPS